MELYLIKTIKTIKTKQKYTYPSQLSDPSKGLLHFNGPSTPCVLWQSWGMMPKCFVRNKEWLSDVMVLLLLLDIACVEK
jgi:hypothetical protein